MGNAIGWLIRRFGLTPNVARYVAYAMLGIAILLLIAAMVSLSQCGKGRQRAAQARLDAAQDQAATNSAADAVNAQAGVNANSTASEDLTRSNEEDIRNAQGANDAVNPAVRDAGLASLCKRAAYRNSERCKLRRAPPR